MKERPDCYTCIHRHSLTGNAHSCCRHPSFIQLLDDPLIAIIAMLSEEGVDPISAGTDGCKVTGNPDGIRGGWFMHPFNFDPIWLISCTGYTPKPVVLEEN